MDATIQTSMEFIQRHAREFDKLGWRLNVEMWREPTMVLTNFNSGVQLQGYLLQSGTLSIKSPNDYWLISLLHSFTGYGITSEAHDVQNSVLNQLVDIIRTINGINIHSTRSLRDR